jgi:tetratricopeptide (TPR) repeat protein
VPGTLRLMRVAVLPFNAAEGTKPAYGRQFAAFASEQLRSHAEADVNTVSYLTQIQDEDGSQRMAFVNISDDLLPYDQLKDLFEQAEVDLVMDGMLAEKEGAFELTVRFHEKGNETPIEQETLEFPRADIFVQLHSLVKRLAATSDVTLPDFLAGETMEFGTSDPEAFLSFLEGFDSLNYIQQANGQVAREFSPQGAFDALLMAVEADKEFEGPYHVLVQLARGCSHFRIGTFEMIEAALTKLQTLVPEDFGATFALAELHQGVGSLNKASELYEKAVQQNPEDPGLLGRLGMVQAQLGMPVNAERNLRKALALEGDDKPSADMLAMVLQQQGRDHEIPSIWKEIVEANPQNGLAHAKYGMSLFQAGKEEDGEKAFETALETVEDKVAIKRFYAPVLAQRSDFDRAMDFYEDVLEAAPGEIPVMIEYAQVLEAADRSFEVPDVLKNVLAANPDPNTRAQVLARLIELEQPKRAESVEAAREKMEAGDYGGALAQLKPMRNWLADYWKMWALLSSAYNRTAQPQEAEDAARRLLELFPGCEPAYGELREALVAQGKADEAYAILRYAASNNPQSLPMHINLAIAAKAAGHIEEARSLAKQIREAVGQNDELDSVLDELER